MRSTERDNDQNQTTYTPRAGFNTTLADVVTEGPSERILDKFSIDQRVDEQAARALMATTSPTSLPP